VLGCLVQLGVAHLIMAGVDVIHAFRHRKCYFSRGGEQMSLPWRTSSGSKRTIWIRVTLAFVALSAVLTARNVPPVFPHATSVHSAIRAISHHDQRPRFDYNGSGWSAPAENFQLVPPAVELVHSASISQLFPILCIKGSHYNRPPPSY
jgi:hypothetical protein